MDIQLSYGDQNLHRKVGKIIRTRSANKEDIREVAKRSIDLKKIHRILDMGCGYGWLEETLGGDFDLIVGIDCVANNRRKFLEATEKIAKKAMFKRMHLPCQIEIPSGFFDLIISAYSLYFFPDVIAEVRRLLHADGIFLIITHSESMLEEGQKFFQFNNLRKVIERFSSERGEAVLRPYFSRIQYIDYLNELVFARDNAVELEDYIHFKSEFIAKDIAPEVLKEKLLYELKERGILRLNKNDRIFLARK